MVIHTWSEGEVSESAKHFLANDSSKILSFTGCFKVKRNVLLLFCGFRRFMATRWYLPSCRILLQPKLCKAYGFTGQHFHNKLNHVLEIYRILGGIVFFVCIFGYIIFSCLCSFYVFYSHTFSCMLHFLRASLVFTFEEYICISIVICSFDPQRHCFRSLIRLNCQNNLGSLTYSQWATIYRELYSSKCDVNVGR